MNGIRRLLTYLTITTTSLVVILDGTVVTVALPSIRSDLGFTESGLSWVANSFFVAFALVLLPAGRLGDRYGARRVFLPGLALFTLASLWCGLAGDPASLLLARAVQGIGGGASTAVTLSMVARLYPEEELRSRAFAGLAFVGSAGASVGLVAGGALVEALSWRWAFLVNVPIGVVAAVAAARLLEHTPGVALRGGLVPRALFADRRFGLANGILFTMVMAGMSFQFLTSLYLQDTLGLSALATGTGFLATSGAIAVASLGVSGRLAQRTGTVRTLQVGLLLFVVGMLLMVRLPDNGSYVADVMVPLVVMGAGFGLAMPQVTQLAMSTAPAAYASAASGFVNTVQQAGGAIGLFAVAGAAAATERGVGYLLAAIGLVAGIVLTTLLQRGRSAAPAPSAAAAS